jgi:hypothetical protein
MAWVESVSTSFRARHNEVDADDAALLLGSLEELRERLAYVFPRTITGVTVVLHRGAVALSLAHPLLPLTWITTAPAARRYVAGWANSEEVHVLAPAALKARASNVGGSREMLERTPAALYTRRVILENNHDLAHRMAPGRMLQELRWAWLLEGGARWFSGQTEYSRPAIARRLHEGRRPSFPPSIRDAPLLGGTVVDLLAREEGTVAAAQFVCRLHPQGGKAALSKAFGGRSLVHAEGAWRSHLARMAAV